MQRLWRKLRQTGNMLPRKSIWRALFSGLLLGLPILLSASLLTSSPVSAIDQSTPEVSVSEIQIQPKKSTQSAGSLSANKSTSTLVLSAGKTDPFTLVGLTWLGDIEAGTKFKVRVRELGSWTDWITFDSGEYHQASAEDGSDARSGTDPLLTALADGIEIDMSSPSGSQPTDLRVTLANSEVTNQDRSVALRNSEPMTNIKQMTAVNVGDVKSFATSPTGAQIARPNIVSRAEWGANESWRDPVPKMGTKIVAGIVHHTASTNNYKAEQSPAQMRILYAYFTKSLKYADMGYHFLVDKYGTIYEGRSGCAVKEKNPCDGAALPAQGAHTYGFNVNTFSVSAIGNYDVLAPENPQAMVNSMASLIAWKLAPYGLDPNAETKYTSTDTTGSSKYRKGQVATIKVISAHRDVGKTACPGRYLYPYMDEIRAEAAKLLTPTIQDVAIAPKVLEPEQEDSVTISAVVPSAATWSITITDETTGILLQNITESTVIPTPTPSTDAAPAAQTAIPLTTKISYLWNKTDDKGTVVGTGRYIVRISAALAGVKLKTKQSVVTVATKPASVSKFSYLKRSKTKAKISWQTKIEPLPLTKQTYRLSRDNGKTWSSWKETVDALPAVTFKKLVPGKSYLVQIKVVNQLGVSKTKSYKFKQK